MKSVFAALIRPKQQLRIDPRREKRLSLQTGVEGGGSESRKCENPFRQLLLAATSTHKVLLFHTKGDK